MAFFLLLYGLGLEIPEEDFSDCMGLRRMCLGAQEYRLVASAPKAMGWKYGLVDRLVGTCIHIILSDLINLSGLFTETVD